MAFHQRGLGAFVTPSPSSEVEINFHSTPTNAQTTNGIFPFPAPPPFSFSFCPTKMNTLPFRSLHHNNNAHAPTQVLRLIATRMSDDGMADDRLGWLPSSQRCGDPAAAASCPLGCGADAGRGVCTRKGVCACNPSWSGPGCETPGCPRGCSGVRKQADRQGPARPHLHRLTHEWLSPALSSHPRRPEMVPSRSLSPIVTHLKPSEKFSPSEKFFTQ